MMSPYVILCLLCVFPLVTPRGWSILLGHTRWQQMKISSSTGKFLREHVTKGKIISSTLASTISSVGLFGSLALFKELEKTIDLNDSASLSTLRSLIDQVNKKIKSQQSAGGDPSLPNPGAPMDYTWIAIGIPFVLVSFFSSCCIFSCLRKFYKLGLQDAPQNQTPSVELIEVPANFNDSNV